MPINRRELLALLSTGTVLVSAAVPALEDAGTPPGGQALSFPQGVASADPTPRAVMLWTRAMPDVAAGRVPVRLQVSRDPDFATLDVDRWLQAKAANDYTLRACVTDLQSGQRYFYRFLGADGSASRTGRTCTAPAPGEARAVRVAFASCQNFEQGHYASWARMLADDESAPEDEQIDFVLHLGDFIYERSWHTRQDGSQPPRRLPPFPDGRETAANRYATSLADYRHLYRTYLEDPWLQAARARWPFVSTWDDHEFSDDNFQSYSAYGEAPAFEPRRKYAANRAWFEYIPGMFDELAGQPAHDLHPARITGSEEEDNRAARDSLCIYRRLQWGSRLDILLTDARSYRSPPCVPPSLATSLGLPMNSVDLVAITDGGRGYNDGQPPENLPYGDGTTANPARDRAPGTCLGETQRNWLLDTARASTATWKLWGNSIPLLPLHLDLSSIPFAGYEDSVFNIDAWLGYPGESALILDTLQAARVTGFVSLSGDHHMHGAATVRARPGDADAVPATVDFSCAGISSSPLFDNVRAIARREHSDFAALVEAEHHGEHYPNWNMTLLKGVLAAWSFNKTGSDRLASWMGPNPANSGLAFADATANGYGLATFGSDELRVRLVAMADVERPVSGTPAVAYTADFRVPLWKTDSGPELEGPLFRGTPPFPFSLATG